MRHFFSLFFLFFFLKTVFVFSQQIQVLESNGPVAVISGGKEAGLRVGEIVRIMRLRNGSWKEISRARITEVQPKLARIEIVEGAPLIHFKPGDYVMKVQLSESKARDRNSADLVSLPLFSVFSPYRLRSAYVGPTLGIFIPMGPLSNILKSYFGYGAMAGFRFRTNSDITARFFYCSDWKDWYFWSLQLLLRRFVERNLFLDFGYGIGYPIIEERLREKHSNIFDRDSPWMTLGFVGGMGYIYKISDGLWFEADVLAHYYPNFCGTSGQFITIQGKWVF